MDEKRWSLTDGFVLGVCVRFRDLRLRFETSMLSERSDDVCGNFLIHTSAYIYAMRDGIKKIVIFF